jgi:hypothetical protein
MTLEREKTTLTEAQLRYHADEARLRGKRADLLDLLLDREWHANHECAAVGGISFHGSFHALRKQGWRIESHYLGPGRWVYRLTGRTTPKQMNGEQRQIARAYVAAVLRAYGDGALAPVLPLLPKWMRMDGSGA